MKELINAYFPTITGADGKVAIRLTIHRAIYFILLFLLVGSQPVSKFMMSGMEILLAVNWLLEWDMRRKFQDFKTKHLLIAFLVLMGVHLVWMLGSANQDYGWYDIFKKLPLLAIPLVILTSRPLNRKQFAFLVLGFVTSVFVANVIGRVRLLTISDLPYRQIIPYISHIRFALNVCLAIVFVCWYAVERFKSKQTLADWHLALCAALLVFFVDFLFIIRSYTAFVILFLTALILMVCYWHNIKSKALRVSLLTVMLAAVLAATVVTLIMVRSYYKPVPLMNEPLASYTANGNPYRHKQDGLIENGNYVNNYICDEEMASEWAKRSAVGLDDTTADGYRVYTALLRYLNALGTTKDSVGMQLLDADDVAAIEKGIANPVYWRGSSLRRMYYVMLYEYENYRNYRAVKDFTMLQRFELWRTGWTVFTKHPLFGVGTGDVVDECHKQLIIDGSPLTGTKKHTHNQYLTFLITFGIVGFLIIAVVFFQAFRRQGLLKLPAAAALMCIVLISFLTEDTLETLAGCVFSVLFLCLLAVYDRTDTEPDTP